MAYICDTVDLLYEEDQLNEKEVLQNEEGLSRRCLDADDRRRVANDLSKHCHPLEGQGDDNVLYNIINGKIAPPVVNVAYAVSTGDKMFSVFRRENCVRCPVYVPAHSDGRTTTAAPTGADLL